MALGLIHRPHAALPLMAARMELSAQKMPLEADWHKAIRLDGDALGNDVHNNCVPCGALRSIQMRRAVVAGDMRTPTAAESLGLYGVWAGWDGNSAKDVGTNSGVAAALWATQGVKWGEQWEDVPAIVWLDPTNLDHLRLAIAYLGPVQLDLALPATSDGQAVWDVGTGPSGSPGSRGYHRVCCGKFATGRFFAITWGIEQPMTEAFVARYAVSAEACVSRSWLNTVGLSPAGLDLAALQRDAAALTV